MMEFMVDTVFLISTELLIVMFSLIMGWLPFGNRIMNQTKARIYLTSSAMFFTIIELLLTWHTRETRLKLDAVNDFTVHKGIFWVEVIFLWAAIVLFRKEKKENHMERVKIELIPGEYALRIEMKDLGGEPYVLKYAVCSQGTISFLGEAPVEKQRVYCICKVLEEHRYQCETIIYTKWNAKTVLNFIDKIITFLAYAMLPVVWVVYERAYHVYGIEYATKYISETFFAALVSLTFGCSLLQVLDREKSLMGIILRLSGGMTVLTGVAGIFLGIVKILK